MQWYKLCPDCVRLKQDKTVSPQSEVLIANQLKIANLEKKKNDHVIYFILLLAVSSAPWAGSIIGILDGMLLGYLGAIVLLLIQCPILILLIKKRKGMNAEIRSLS